MSAQELRIGLLSAVLLGLSCAPPEPPPQLPKLVLVLAIDQLRADRLDPTLPGGLGRLAREGRVYTEALLGHAHSDTCSGHVALATGRHPGPAGVPGNNFIDRDTFREWYCVEDDAPDAAVIGGFNGRSPRNIRVTGLGDWLKDAHPESRVFSLSAKDRAAIGMGGQHPDGVFWLDRGGAGAFTTSLYYSAALPEWLVGWSADRIIAGLPESWDYEGSLPRAKRSDDFVGENPMFNRTSPHALVRPADAKGSLNLIYYSPFIDQVTLELAEQLVEQEKLGEGNGTDLLFLSLSGTDLVGHLYGPFSQESAAALVQLDQEIGQLIALLEARVGKDDLLVALSSDHGVLPLPEWLEETGASRCPLPHSRGQSQTLDDGLHRALEARFGSPARSDLVTEDQPGLWVARSGYRVTVNRAAAEFHRVKVEDIVSVASAHLAKQPEVMRVWTAAELVAGEGPPEFVTLYQNSYDAERGGDLIIQSPPDCLISPYPVGTSHGTPYSYDRAVPLVFWGAGVEPGEITGEVLTVDLAATLAAQLRLETPRDLDGRALDLKTPGNAR